eukprot:2473329-Rhodomonas_salina.3
MLSQSGGARAGSNHDARVPSGGKDEQHHHASQHQHNRNSTSKGLPEISGAVRHKKEKELPKRVLEELGPDAVKSFKIGRIIGPFPVPR